MTQEKRNVQKLAGLDAGFLYSETDRAPAHIASIQVLELAPETCVASFIADFKQLLLARAHLVPYFTSRLQWVPLQLDHPVWVRDPNFQIDHHVRHIEVPAPGGRRELEQTIAQLHAIPLDLGRPLWEIWVLSGLEGGRIAYYNRVHHACLDGVSGQAAIQAIMDVTSQPRSVEPAPAAFANRRTSYSAVELMLGAFENIAKFQIRQASRLLDHVETVQRLWQRSVDPSKGLGAAADTAPRTRFNQTVGKERAYAVGELPLAEVKSIGKATGTSINDVFLAVCSGALRRYFSRTGELPAKPLIAGCPVSLRRPGDDAANNQVTMMMVSFATDEADPVKRLLKIGHSAAQAKGLVADIAGSYDSDPVLPGLPGLLRGGVGLLEAGRLADLPLTSPPCNVVVSNVPGPRQTMYSLGAKVLTHYPVSIPAHGQGVNITVQSYADQLFFGITGCAKALPDPEALREDMLAAFVELKERVLKAPTALVRRDPVAEPAQRAPLAERGSRMPESAAA
jgi:diacylglycerol O-acyltransferase / wax synthase